MLKVCVRHGMVVEKFHEIISFKRSKCLEKNISFITQKRNQAVNDFEKDYCKLLPNAIYRKAIENVRNRTKVEFIRKDDNEKIIRQQPKLTFNGIHKSYENCVRYTIKQNEILMDKPNYIIFDVLDFSNLLMYNHTSV